MEKEPTTKDKLTMIAMTKMMVDRGNALTFWFRNVLGLMAFIVILIGYVSTTGKILLGIIVGLGVFVLGWLDMTYIHLYQKELDLQAQKYTPFFNKLDKKMEHLIKEVERLTKK